MNNKISPFGLWLIFAAIVTVISGSIYTTNQQNYRTSANDPQIEITEEISNAITNGAPPDQIIPAGSNGTDIKTSLSAVAMVFDKDGKVLGSSAKLNGKDPAPPKGVFEKASAQGRNILTWEPEKGVRLAAVIVPVKSNNETFYVLAGKNLREVELREKQLALLCAIAWIVLLLLSALLSLALVSLSKSSPALIEKDTEVIVIENSTPDEKA